MKMKMDQGRGPLTGRIAGEYEDVMIHIFSVSYIKRF